MKRKTAAEYLEVHPDTFTKEVACGRMPSPIMFGGQDHWRKEEIDRAIERLGGNSHIDDIRARLHAKVNRGKAA